LRSAKVIKSVAIVIQDVIKIIEENIKSITFLDQIILKQIDDVFVVFDY